MSLDISERKRIADFEDCSHCLNFYITKYKLVDYYKSYKS